MEIDNIYLVNYRHSASDPLKSITQLPKEEAFTVAKELYKNGHCPAHRRFGTDFQFYYPYRLKVEKWLYENFVSMGGKPQTEHPFYFVVQHCDNLFVNFNSGVVTSFKLNHIDIHDISFTFGDSMAQMEKAEKPVPFLKDTLLEYISTFGNDVEKFVESIKEQYVCVEAQLWTEKYFTK